MRPQLPKTEDFNTAIAWLRCNEGDSGESEACAAVAKWIETEEFERYLRHEARTAGVPVAALRRKLADRGRK